MFSIMTAPTSLLEPAVVTIITDFSVRIVPTVLAVIAIVIPVGLTCWGIGFGVKKGINFLQRKANKAL